MTISQRHEGENNSPDPLNEHARGLFAASEALAGWQAPQRRGTDKTLALGACTRKFAHLCYGSLKSEHDYVLPEVRSS